MNNAQLLIKSRPIWQQPAPRALPVTVRSVYTVLGRQGQRWQTILRSTDDIDDAREIMQMANDTGTYERLVIASGNSVNMAPAASWNTIECALPQSNFQQMLARLQHEAVNSNTHRNTSGFYLIGEKEPQKFLLALAIGLAIATQIPAAIGIAVTCAILDTIFMMDKRPLSFPRALRFNRARNWAFAALNGAFLLLLLI